MPLDDPTPCPRAARRRPARRLFARRHLGRGPGRPGGGAAVARSGRNVGQPDHVLANPIAGHKAERRPGAGEEWLAVTKHDGVEVESILIDKAKVGQASRQVRAGNFDLPGEPGLQPADRRLEVILDKRGVGADRLQRARHDPFRLAPPRRREVAFLRVPLGMVFVPVRMTSYMRRPYTLPARPRTCSMK